MDNTFIRIQDVPEEQLFGSGLGWLYLIEVDEPLLYEVPSS